VKAAFINTADISTNTALINTSTDAMPQGYTASDKSVGLVGRPYIYEHPMNKCIAQA
jgi:hypothetical protein